MRDEERDSTEMRGAFVNSKGFGGNNATGFFMSPQQTEQMLEKRYGEQAYIAAQTRRETTLVKAHEYNDVADSGSISPIYRFGEGVLEGKDLDIGPNDIKVPGFAQSIKFNDTNPFEDMT